MTVMMLNGLLYCLLFMLTSAAMGPQTAGLQMYEKESRVEIQARNAPRARACRGLDGICQSVRNPCPSDRPLYTEPGRPYCTRRSEHCCYPKPCITPEECCAGPGECFFLYASNQCFCVFNSTLDGDKKPNATFQVSKDFCEQNAINGLILPHPTDAVALRSEIVQHYGNCGHLWLNAKCTDTNIMRWLDNWVEITIANSLFANNPWTPPCTTGTEVCLEIRADEEALANSPDKPYYTDSCDDKTHYHILCEKIK